MRRKKIMQPDITTLRNSAARPPGAHIDSLIDLIHATATAPTEKLKAAETPEKYGANTPQKKIKKSVDTDCAQ